MNDKILIVSLARHDDATTSTTFQLSKCFNKDHDVLIVEHPYTWSELLKNLGNSKGRLRLRATLSTQLILKKKDGLNILIPPAVPPINFLSYGKLYRVVSWINHRLMGRKVNKFLKDNGWEDYYFVNSYNYHFPRLHRVLKGTISRKVYHCVDPIVKSYTKKHGIRNERIAVTNSDLVVSTAKSLQEKWKAFNPSYLVPNAVDFEHFNQSLEVVPSIRKLGTRVIGYFGNIERRMDYSLLIKTFKTHPEWQLVLAGPVEKSFIPQEFLTLKNVHFIGAYAYHDLPNMINSVDAVLIPFKCDEASKAIYPLKLYEYFSVGKPVVSTFFNPDALSALRDEMYLATENNPLDQAIAAALNEDNSAIIQKRKAIASQNTWEQRASDFISILKTKEHDSHYQKQNKKLSGIKSGSEAALSEAVV